MSHTLTGHSGSVSQGVHDNKSVLQAPPPDSLGSDQNQRFPLKWWHLGYLLVDLQLVPVKLCSSRYTCWMSTVIDALII